MTEQIQIRRLDRSFDEARDALALAHPDGTIFHDSRWRTVIELVFKHQSVEFGAFDGDELVGFLPLMRVPTLSFGRRNLVSMPYGVYGGAISQRDDAARALLAAAVDEGRRTNVGRVELRCVEPLPEDYPHASEFEISKLYSTFVADLPDEPEEVLARMPKKARAEARKARNKHGLDLILGDWYVEDLYRMFMKNKRSLGSPGLPAKLFRELLTTLGSACHVHLVRRQRQPLAAVMSFAYGDTLVAYYSGTEIGADREFSVSNFMYMALQEWAVEHGFKKFDFCRSRGESGAYKFKLHQGFEATQLNYSYLPVKSDGVPSFTPSNPRTKLLRNAWSKLPLVLVERMSPRLSRYLS